MKHFINKEDSGVHVFVREKSLLEKKRYYRINNIYDVFRKDEWDVEDVDDKEFNKFINKE